MELKHFVKNLDFINVSYQVFPASSAPVTSDLIRVFTTAPKAEQNKFSFLSVSNGLINPSIAFIMKTGLEKYCSIKTSHTGVNNMWILKNSTNLLSSLDHWEVHKATSIQTFDFSTLYTSIPHDLLKSRMNNIINNAFKHKNGAT